MGCDIHSYSERKSPDGKWEMLDFSPFDWRSYGIYGFLAGVRNYSAIPPIAEPRGMPNDASAGAKDAEDGWAGDGHTYSWLSVEELLAFNYDAVVEDRRYTRQEGLNHFNGGATCEPGQGEKTTFREFLGEGFFGDLKKLQGMGAERIVFWFDN